jgi:hypothetical protein
MKQISASIGIMALLVCMSLADIDLGDFPDTQANWDASQNSACMDFELPEHVLDGSDESCLVAAIFIAMAMDYNKVDCIFITNKGFIPTTENPISRESLEQLLESDGGPFPYDPDWRQKP